MMGHGPFGLIGVSAPVFRPALLTAVNSYFDSRLDVTTSLGSVTGWKNQIGGAVAGALSGAGGSAPTVTTGSFGSVPAVTGIASSGLQLAATINFPTACSIFTVVKFSSHKNTVNRFGTVPLCLFTDSLPSVKGAWGFSDGSMQFNQTAAGTGNNFFTSNNMSLSDGVPHVVGMTYAANGDIKFYKSGVQVGATQSFAYSASFYLDTLLNGYNGAIAYVDGYVGDVGAILTGNAVWNATEIGNINTWARANFPGIA